MEGEEESSFTILEFTRKYVTCDKNDLPITVRKNIFCCETDIILTSTKLVECCVMDNYSLAVLQSDTARVLWSFHATSDPTSKDIPFSLIHDYQGSVSLNLLGGMPSAAPDPENLQYYDIRVDRVSCNNHDILCPPHLHACMQIMHVHIIFVFDLPCL